MSNIPFLFRTSFRCNARLRKLVLIACVSSAFGLAAVEPRSAKSQTSFVPFDEFLAETSAAVFSDYEGRENVQVTDPAAFHEMKDYLLGLYQNIGGSHSFVEDVQTVDCVPLQQQPGLRGASTAEVNVALAAGLAGPGAPITEPAVTPPQLKSGPAAPGETHALDLTLPRGERDVFGNSISCARGSIPMRRITLDEMVRFPTLEEFLQGSKVNEGPLDIGGGGQNEIEPADPQCADPHCYARGVQFVDNFGGDAWLNVWSPSVRPHQMSLSQLWVVSGDGENKQTLEAGWQVYPDKWHTDKAVLFIFSTTQGYKVTKPPTRCYNLECKAFVQVANNVYLGRGFTHYSSIDGDQWGFNLQWKRNTDGNWWLFYRGPGNYIPVGFYPKSWFGTGALSTKATKIAFGGEDTGDPSALQMGSGRMAAEGWKKAAFLNFIFYIDTTVRSQWANLGKVETPMCYTADVHNIFGSWGTYLFFGGPRCPNLIP
jgi:hypothetical protein